MNKSNEFGSWMIRTKLEVGTEKILSGYLPSRGGRGSGWVRSNMIGLINIQPKPTYEKIETHPNQMSVGLDWVGGFGTTYQQILKSPKY